MVSNIDGADRSGAPFSPDPPRGHHILCVGCDSVTVATEAGHIEETGASGRFRLALLQCRGCYSAALIQQEYPSRKNDLGLSEPVRLWPEARAPLSEAVPQGIRLDYQEAVRCIDNRAFKAAAVMVGRTLESVCADHEKLKSNLMSSLEAMRSANVIDDRLYQWADELRLLRNLGAHHSAVAITRQDAYDALALCEALLDYVYVLGARFAEFQNRRRQ